MSFNKHWESLCVKRPELRSKTAKITIDAENFEYLLYQFYEQGVKSVGRVEKTERAERQINPLGDMFGSIFGGRK